MRYFLHLAEAAMMKVWIAVIGVLSSVSAQAASTTTYTYDALGRLTNASTTGTVNNGVQVSTTYDPADNRVTYKVTGSTSRTTVVVPLNGLTVIPLSDQ